MQRPAGRKAVRLGVVFIFNPFLSIMINIIAFGINHKTAGLKLREQVAETKESLPAMLATVMSQAAVEEALIISTCNRTEWYFITEDAFACATWLQQRHHISANDFEQSFYRYQGRQAIMHLISVATGLDSMVLGEPQIFGQLKEAVKIAHEQGTIGARLDPILQQAFAVTKKVREETELGRFPVSVASAAVNLAGYIFKTLADLNILLIGAGDTIERAAHYFYQKGVKSIITANRTWEKAQQIAETYSGAAIPFEKIHEYLSDVDIVLTATASTTPILTRAMVASQLKKRTKPIFLLDMAVPRDIAADVANIDGVYLYNIDDLQEVTQQGLTQRQHAAKQAQAMIEKAVDEHFVLTENCYFTQTICAYRNQVAQIRDQELQKALQLLEKGLAPDQILRLMSRALTNKLMHRPSVELRQASREGGLELLIAAKRLLGINVSELEKP
jgi:glutamyl-tRNA reductase